MYRLIGLICSTAWASLAVRAMSLPSNTPTKFSFDSVSSFHCPFDVSATVVFYFSSIDFTYISNSDKHDLKTLTLDAIVARSNRAVCFVRVALLWEPSDNSLTVTSIDYEGHISLEDNKTASLETQMVWDGASTVVRSTSCAALLHETRNCPRATSTGISSDK